MTIRSKFFQLCLQTGDIFNGRIFDNATSELLYPVVAESLANKSLISTRSACGFSNFFSSRSDIAHIFYISKLLLRIPTPIAKR